jgi:hypothetical protein
MFNIQKYIFERIEICICVKLMYSSTGLGRKEGFKGGADEDGCQESSGKSSEIEKCSLEL